MKLLVCMVSVLAFAVALVSGFSPKRSPRWDRHLTGNRYRREAAREMSWQSGEEGDECTLVDNTMEFDKLKRRQSGLLADPQNQGRCGNCWAFASVHTYTDTLSVSINMTSPLLSAQYLTTCLTDEELVGDGNGCCGGNLEAGVISFQTMGAVTNTCAPYDLGYYRASEYKQVLTLSEMCPTTCSDETKVDPNSNKIMNFKMLKTEQEVISALNDGSVITSMNAPNDFSLYICGILSSSDDTPGGDDKDTAGGHAVEIVDYGTTSNDEDFWVVKNSYGEKWGENGYFRVLRNASFFGLDSTYVQIKLNSNEEPDNMTTNITTCGAKKDNSPEDDELIVSAAEHAVSELNDAAVIGCPNTSREDVNSATNLTLSTIESATSQVVKGIEIVMTITANITGCIPTGQTVINATVFYSTNNTFNITDYAFAYVEASSGHIIYSSGIIILVMALLSAYQLQ